MESETQIEPLAGAHLDACARLLVSAFAPPPWNEAWTPDTAATRLKEILNTPGSLGFVCLALEPIGFVAGHTEQGEDNRVYHLKELCVHPDRQRSGVGSALLRHLAQSLEAEGISEIYLLTYRNSVAESFYRKHGFRPARRTAVFVRRPEPDAASDQSL